MERATDGPLTPPPLDSRVPELDGIRGLAIVLVLFYHFVAEALPAFAPGSALAYLRIPLTLTWTGVDCFFVLSGFLIGGILIDARGSPHYFRTFYVRRFARVLPLYYLLLALVALARALEANGVPGLEELLKDTPPLGTQLLFAQNVWIALTGGFVPNPLNPTWSLAVEEQFYLTLPFLIRFTPRRLLALVGLVPVVLAVAVRYWVLHHSCLPQPEGANYVLLPSRMDALGLGVTAAWLRRTPCCWNWLTRFRVAECGFLAVAAAGWLLAARGGQASLDNKLTTSALLYFVLLLAALSRPGGPVGRVMRWGWLRHLGTLCYGLYLLHVPLLYLCHWALGPVTGYPRPSAAGGWAASAAALVLTVVLAKLSWEWFEKPFVRLGHRWKY
jgi:peptidoglycan/LPS O-acetylase OafA/YrhL